MACKSLKADVDELNSCNRARQEIYYRRCSIKFKENVKMLAVRIVQFFPAAALLISMLALWQPWIFNAQKFLIVPLLGFIMLGMGSVLSLQDFANAVKKPRAVLLGLLLQFLLMPFLAFVIGKVLHLPPEQFIGLVMVGAVAGGTASNVITCLAGGDVALSITMTACSTAAGVFLTPLIASFYLKQSVTVPVWAMFQSILCVVALPVSLGLIINRLLRKYNDVLNKICPVVSAVGIIWVIAIIVSLNSGTVSQWGAAVFAAVVLHNGSGMAAGYFLARLFRCDKRTAVTIAIEVGMQNSGLAAALSQQFFSTAATLPGTIFSIWHNLSGALFAGIAKPRLEKD